MGRRHFGDGQEIVMEDFNALSAALQSEFYDRLGYELMQRGENAFFSDSFLVSYSNSNTLIVKKGLGFQTDLTQTSPEPKRRPLYLSADATVSISPPSNVNNRIDIVCVKNSIVAEITASRNYKDATSGTISQENFVVQKDWQAEILIVAGVASGSPAAPATPNGYIKIAQVVVTAATGISGSGAVSDSRVKLPIGGDVVLNTLGRQRVTAGANVPLSTIVTDIDNLLKNGYMNFFDVDDLGADPAAPSATKRRIYSKGGILFMRDPSGTIIPIGSGGGGGGAGANWQPLEGEGPVEAFENSEKVWLFSPGLSQKLTLFVKVPDGYLIGSDIKMKCGFYSPSAAGSKFIFQSNTKLIRKGTDAIDSVANQLNTSNTEISTGIPNLYQEVEFNITDSTGKVNAISVSPGDILKITFGRTGTVIGPEDVNDVRFVPSLTEVSF